MLIGEKTIRTPSDDPVGYDLTWRWQAAQAAMEVAAGGGRIPWMLIKDGDVRALIQHLQRRRKHPLQDGEKPTAFDIVLGWRESPTAPLIESFLVAANTYAEAAHELGLPVEPVTLYSRLFHDLRDDQGVRRPAVLMRLLAALNDGDDVDLRARLRRIALTGGIWGVRHVLHAGAPAADVPLEKLVEQELLRRFHRGELRTGDLIKLQANAISRQRLELDKKGDGAAPMIETLNLARGILALTAPHIVQTGGTQDQVEASTQAIRSRLAAQRNVNATPVTDDAERGEKALTELMQTQFRAVES